MSARLKPVHRDTLAGLIFVAFGTAFAGIAAGYPLGTAMRMGPGYFPIVLGVALSAIGLVIVLSGRRGGPTETGVNAGEAGPVSQRLRPALLISASVLLFAVTIESIGLALSTFGVVVVSSLADRERHWPHVLASAALLSMIAVGVFAYGLRLPFKVLPF